jgi:hypothetical protein
MLSTNFLTYEIHTVFVHFWFSLVHFAWFIQSSEVVVSAKLKKEMGEIYLRFSILSFMGENCKTLLQK